MLSLLFVKNSKLIPIIRKPKDADICSNEVGIILLNDPPSTTPIKLARTRANDDPIKTANGLLLLPLIANVAIWVLSPNSAIKIVINVDIKIAEIIKIHLLVAEIRL